MRRTLLLVTASLISTGLLVPAASTATSTTVASAAVLAAPEPLVTKTVRIGGKRVQFVLAADADERAYVRMKLRRDGRWKTVATDRSECRYYAGSHDPFLQVQKAVKQVFIGWTGTGEGGTAEYGGYNVRRTEIVMYGVDEPCPAAG